MYRSNSMPLIVLILKSPISKIRFFVPKTGCRRSEDPISRFRFGGHISFIFQEERWMKIEHVLFPSIFFKITDPCLARSCLEQTKIGSREPTIKHPKVIKKLL